MTQVSRTKIKDVNEVLFSDQRGGLVRSGTKTVFTLKEQLNSIAESVVFRTTELDISPSLTDDAAGTALNGTFSVGDIWVNKAIDVAYMCVDDSVNNAMWVIISNNSLNLADLNDMDTEGITDGQTIVYNVAEQAYVPHTLTTKSLADIDDTDEADGAVLLYDGISEQYKSTQRMDNANTQIIGGTF